MPGRGRATWRDWYTHEVVDSANGGNVTLSAPLGHINVHVRDGAAILLHSKPAYTIEETRQSPFSLLVSLAKDGVAFGDAYIDDGETVPPTPSRTVKFHAAKSSLSITGQGSFTVAQKLETVTILGAQKPQVVTAQGKQVHSWQFIDARDELVISNLAVDFNSPATIAWH